MVADNIKESYWMFIPVFPRLNTVKNFSNINNSLLLSTGDVSGMVGLPRAASAKIPPANAEDIRDAVHSLGWEDYLEEGMVTYSSILAWRILYTEERGGLQSIGLQRVKHD